MQNRLQISAFDAINQMIRGAPADNLEMVAHMVELIVTKLRETMQTSNIPPEDMERIPDLQSMLCGCLGVILRRLEAGDDQDRGLDVAVADVIMEILLNLFQIKSLFRPFCDV